MFLVAENMMKIELKRMQLSNYKKFQNDTFNFYKRTKVSGKNREGKSTLMNAYMEIMTGKEADGTQPDSIRPHQIDGTDLNRTDIIREVVLNIDGTETTIRKITKQKWRKPHGQTEEVLDGNTVSYEIDGFSYAPKKFEEYMKEWVDSEIFLMCSNPNPFLSVLKKSTVDARKILEKLSGFSLKDFLERNPKYMIVSDLTKGHSVEDTMKKLRKQLNDQKKKLEQKDTEFKYEQTRDPDELIKISDLELKRAEWEEKILGVDKQEQDLDQAITAYDSANTEILTLKSKLNEIVNTAGASLREQRAAMENNITELNIQNKEYTNYLKMAELDFKHAKMGIERYKFDLEKVRSDYSICSAKTFDETKIREIESEQFDENSFICPECGQVRPEEQRNNLRETFEERKIRRIEAHNKLKQIFDSEITAQLDSITEIGNKTLENLKTAQEAKKESEEKIKEIRQKIISTSDAIEKLCAEIDKLPKEVDLSVNKEYQELSELIKKKEFILSSMDNGSVKRFELRQQRNGYIEEISKLNTQIQKTIADQEQKERKLKELKAEFDQQKQAVANIERDMDILNQFSIEKNAALAEKINPFMDGFKFNFLTYTLEKNPVECCQIIKDGTEYNNLNYSDRLLVEALMIRGFQKMNNLDLPIWIDNSESINDDRLPELDTQMIVLKVMSNSLKIEPF